MLISEQAKLRVLLVEDNPGDVDLVRLYLSQELLSSVELSCVSSLRDAREVIEPDEVDLVLLDLGLPDGAGVNVVDAMRRMASDVPIVVLTGRDDLDSGLEALKSDAQDYLVKDQLNASMLRRSIQYAIERHRWQQQYRHQLSISPDGMIVLDETGEVRFANAAAVEMLGEPPVSSADLPAEVHFSAAAPSDVGLETGLIVEARCVHTDWQGRDARLVTLRDITDRRRAEEALGELTIELQRTNERLEQLVSTDPLTEILNRRGVEDALSHELERIRRTGDQLIAILVDCDDFKGINDTHGHAVGDAALKALTSAVRKALRGGDHVARVGGDEFLVLLPGTTIAEGMAVAEKLRQAIKATTFPVATGSFALSASLAVGVVSSDVVSLEEVLASVNLALKRSKRSGKDRVSAQLPDGSRGPTAIEPGPGNDLDADAIELRIALQSIRRLDTEEIVGFEALTRGPPGLYALPGDLFRAAHEQNVLASIDLRALRAGLEVLGSQAPMGWYHVNLFPSTVLSTPPDEIARLLSETGAEGRLCVELSEQQFLGDPANLREPLAALRAHGVRVAIDDVGFGRSSVEALLILDPDVVKVDRRCLQGITRHPWERRQFERLIAMLSAVGATVIVEGVETDGELAILRDLGVEYAQGFFWKDNESSRRE